MKNDLKKIIYKMGVICFIDTVLDVSIDYYWGNTGRKKDKVIESLDGRIVLETTFKFDDNSYYQKNEYEIKTKVLIKGYHYLNFELDFNQSKKNNEASLYDFLDNGKNLDNSNYDLISDAISYNHCVYNYKKFMNIDLPQWVIEEIEVMYQEQMGRLNNTYKKDRIEQYFNNRDVEYVEITDKRKNVLYLLGNVISDLYQEELGQAEVLTKQDQKKCLELLRNVILPLIGEYRDWQELDSIVKNASKRVNYEIKSSGKTLLLEDKKGEN